MLNTESSADIYKLFEYLQTNIKEFDYDVDQRLQHVRPTYLITGTITLLVAFYLTVHIICAISLYCRNFRKNIKITLFKALMMIPCFKWKVKQQEEKTRAELIERVKHKRKNQVYELPQKPWKEETILARNQKGSEEAKKYYTAQGKLSGGVYTDNNDHWDFIGEIMRLNIESNPLHMVEFSHVAQFEAEIIRMTLKIFNGNEDSCGLATSGGTESIILAILAYREWGRKKGITNPNIVTPVTAHAAFDKACFYLNVEQRKVPLTKDYKTDLQAMRNMIDSNTVCIVGSCPDYAFGIFDPMDQIGAIALEYGTNCHSDCCLGSFINPFTEPAGFKSPHLFDFRAKGVTQISCDPHKFCYGPKGMSILMFRNKELRRNTFFGVPDWTGGLYCTPSIAGSRPGNIVAGTWAALMKQGQEGFTEKARIVLDAARKIRQELAKIPEIKVISFDDTPVVAFTSTKVNCIALQDILAKKHHWILNALQHPNGAHLVVTQANAPYWKDLAPLVQEAVEFLLKNPKENNRGDAVLYGIADMIPDKTVIQQAMYIFIEANLDAL